MDKNAIPTSLLERLRDGMVIPAMPLALDHRRQFDPRRQRALIRYYIDAGAGGLAVAVHTTQFEIRDPQFNLLAPVLNLASEAIDAWCTYRHTAIMKIAGVCGRTAQALREAELAREAGYHACLVSLAAFSDDSVETMVAHCREISRIMPVIGFYLQPAVGGRVLPYEFWRRFVEIENLLAIKVAPFNRYYTLDVVRAVCDAGREKEVALYTGNDDHIVMDLLTEYVLETPAGTRRTRMAGGLLGHWAVWTKRAVELLEEIKRTVREGGAIPPNLLTLGEQITECNAAFFDAAHGFAGCIAGLHYVLQRQGLLEGIWCLDPQQRLSPGQQAEIDRVYQAYPELNDDDFVQAHLSEWLE